MTIEARPRGAEKTRRRPGRGALRQREAPSRPDDFLVVGLGASAGGLEALNKLFDALPPDTGMAFVPDSTSRSDSQEHDGRSIGRPHFDEGPGSGGGHADRARSTFM